MVSQYLTLLSSTKYPKERFIMDNELPVVVLDGADTIGGTKILLREEKKGLLLDFGLNYNNFYRFYEEYLKPRTSAGLLDIWLLNLIPPYPKLYRPDLTIGQLPNAQELPIKKLDGVILSHAHMDHAGLIGALNVGIPVLSSSSSLAVLRAYQDSGRTEFYQEAAYASPFEVEGCRTHTILKRGNWRSCPSEGRDAILIEGALSENLRELWQREANPDGSGRQTTCGAITTIENSSLDWEIKAFPVDHSIPGACATIIGTTNGTIAYTGDLRFSGSKGSSTRQFVQEAKRLGTSILITEGTQVSRKNECTTTERECKTNCLEVVEDAGKKLVIADFSPRNVERLANFLEVADGTERRLVILPKDAYLLDCLKKVENNVPAPSESLLIYDTPKAQEAKWEQWIYSIYLDHLVAAPQISTAQGEYILAFSFFDMKFLNDIRPSGGLYIYSSSEPYTEDERLDFNRLYNWLSFYKFDIKGFDFQRLEDGENFRIHTESGYHCSGHATSKELEDLIYQIQPEVLIPVHTDNPRWFNEKFGDTCKVMVPKPAPPH